MYSFFTIDRRDIPAFHAVVEWKQSPYRKLYINKDEIFSRLTVYPDDIDTEDIIIQNNIQYLYIGEIIGLTYIKNDNNAQKIRRWLIDDIIPSVYHFPYGTVNNL